MLAKDVIDQACRREHRAILQCCAEWDRQGSCSADLAAALTHHQVVLQALREYLRQHYQTDWHPGTDERARC